MDSLLPFAVSILSHYGYILLFLGTIIAGELVILAAIFLAVLGYFNIYIVIAISLVGTIISDSLWYWIGIKSGPLISWAGKWLPGRTKIKAALTRNFNGNLFKMIVIGKFLYGTRTALLMACGHWRVPYKSFFYYNVISTIIWLMIIAVLGVLMGFSWDYFKQFNGFIRYFVLWGVIVLLIVRLWVRRFAQAISKTYEPRS